MANYRKSFNFRNGVQVDNDNFVVTSGGLVGIGTSLPQNHILDVYGDTRISGLVTVGSLSVSETVKVGSGITMDSTSGIISATTFYGDGSNLTGITIESASISSYADSAGISTYAETAGIATYAGTAGIATYAGTAGIATALENSRDFSVSGDVTTSAAVGFVGTDNVDLVVTLSSDFSADTSGIITSTGGFYGNLTGIASTATELETSRDFSVSGDVLSHTVSFNGTDNVGLGVTLSGTFSANTSGIITSTGGFYGDLTGNLTGIASTATELQNPRNFSVSGDVLSHTVSFNGTGDVGLGVTLSGSFSADTTGIITSTGGFYGNLTGIASTATELQNSRDFSVSGDVATSAAVGFAGTDNVDLVVTLSSDFSADTSGIITSTGGFYGDLTGRLISLTENLAGDQPSISLRGSQFVTPTITIGSTAGIGITDAKIEYTISSEGTGGTLNITNNDVGGVNINLHSGTGIGSTEPFSVRYDNNDIFRVTYDGKSKIKTSLSINGTNDPSPDEYVLDVNGNARITQNAVISNDAKIVGVLTVGQGNNAITLGDGSSIPIPESQNFNITSGISTFNELGLNTIRVGVITATASLRSFNAIAIGDTVAISDFSGLDAVNDVKIFSGGSAYFDKGLYSRGDFVISNSNYNEFKFSDPRPIPEDLGAKVPPFYYGSFQLAGDQTNIGSNLNFVYDVGVSTVGFGSTNLGLIPQNHLPDGDKYLTTVGINTFFARGILDVGAGSSTMNSYFIPPSLDQGNIDIMRELWKREFRDNITVKSGVSTIGVDTTGIIEGMFVSSPDGTYSSDPDESITPTVTSVGVGVVGISSETVGTTTGRFIFNRGTGSIRAGRVTPDGIPGGALLYNTTTDRIQQRNTADSFRNLSPVVAFATVNNGTLVSTDGYNLAMADSFNDAIFTFTNNLPNANYTVIVSNQGASTFTVPETDKTTSGFKITFSSSANSESYSVMVLQI